VKRHEFITLLGGAAAAWPLAARAQQPAAPVIGYLSALSEAQAAHQLTAFRRGLNEVGFVEGQNVAIEFRWGAGEAGRHRTFARELIALAPDVILAGGSLAVAALQQATRTVPIVFAGVADRVGAGFVDSLARPGGNTTGFMNFEYSLSGKWLELLKQIANVVLGNPSKRVPTAASDGNHLK